MRTTKATTVMTLVALLGCAGAALAQTPVRPPVPPTPVVAPIPMPRIVSVPEISVAIPPIAIDLSDLPAFTAQARLSVAEAKEIAAQALGDTRLIRQSSIEAMERAFEAMEKTKFDFNFDFQDKFTYDFRSGSDYNAGKDLMNERKYEQAIVRFDKVIAQKTANIDGALYWKAYSQFKTGKSDESLATIALLRKDHAQSKYLQDAKALEADARKMAGKPVNPADADDEEIKLLALGSLQNVEPERAIPLLEGVLTSTNSLKIKRRALYILALNSQPRAYQILLNYAKGAGNPDLQLEAIRYVAANRNKQTNAADLMSIYQSSQDTEVKLAIISALRSTGNSMALSQIVSSGSTPMVIRSSALSGLSGVMSPQDLWTLYEKETNKDLKMQMVSLFGSMQAIDQLSRVVKTEKDQEVRRRALRSLGNLKTEKTGQMLVDLYGSEQDVEAKKSIISSLGTQNNAEGLVAIARKESSLPLKTEIVRKLSEMAPRNKVAADYLMEIIK